MGGSVNLAQVARLADDLESKGFVEKCADYALSWAPVDEEIRGLCEVRRPGHDSFADVYPKVVIVDGAYRAGLSRCLTQSTNKRFDPHAEVTRWFCHDGHNTIESAIESVAMERSTDSASFLHDCLVAHGKVVCELRQLGDSGKYPGSFVSKYLHFHNSDFVIYDGVASEQMTTLLGKLGGFSNQKDIERPKPKTYYEPYYEHLSRFLYLLEAGKLLQPDVTIKQLDHFLWNAWT